MAKKYGRKVLLIPSTPDMEAIIIDNVSETAEYLGTSQKSIYDAIAIGRKHKGYYFDYVIKGGKPNEK